MKEHNTQIALRRLFLITTTPMIVLLHEYTLDASWAAIFDWTFSKNIEFGKDIIFTAIPPRIYDLPYKSVSYHIHI